MFVKTISKANEHEMLTLISGFGGSGEGGIGVGVLLFSSSILSC